MDGQHKIYTNDPISSTKLHSSQDKNKWVSVKFIKTRSNLWQQPDDNFVHLKGKSTLTIKHILNSICSDSFLWNLLITYSIWLNFILVTYIYIFIQPQSMDFNMFPVILLLDLLFLLDTVRSTAMFFGHQKLGGRISDKTKSAFIYLDIVLALPIDYFIYYFHPHLQSAWFITFRIVCTIRIYRLITFFNHYTEEIAFHHTMMGIIKFLSIFSLVEHSLTCVWYRNSVGRLAEERRQVTDRQFIAEDYYNTTCYTFPIIAHFGHGFIKLDSSMEIFLSCTGMIFGYFLFAVVLIPTIWNWFHANHINGTNIYNKQKYTSNYLQSINFLELIPEISKYYKMFWKRKRGIKDPALFNALNFALQDDVLFDKNYKFLKNAIIFQGFSESYLRRISFAMKHEFYNSGDYIFKQNCVKDKMICVVKGVIDVSSYEDSNSPIISFGAGTCLAECALVWCLLSKTAVKAATYVEVQVIYRDDFYKTIPHYPEQYGSILSKVQKRLSSAKEKLLNDIGLTIDKTEASFIEKLKGKSKTKTRINISQAYVHYKTVERAKSKFMNRSNIHLTWFIIICICALYVAISYPYHICFKKSVFDIIGIICEVLFIIDVFVSIFKRGFKNSGNKVIWKTSAAIKCLDSPYFYLNIFSAFPLEIFALAWPFSSNFSYINLCSVLKLNRLLKVYKIHLLLKLLQLKLVINICCIKIAEILAIYILFIYWTASFLYFLACYNHSCVENSWFANKIDQENTDKLLEPLTRKPFALSTYFSSCILLGIEVGDVVPTNKIETVIVGVLILLGIMLRGSILAIFIGAINLADTSKLAYQTKLYSVLSITKKYFFPEKLTHRFIQFYELQWVYKQDITVEGLDSIDQLPKNLEKEIRIAETLDALESVKLFSTFDEEFLKWVAYNAKVLLLPPKEVVLYQGSTTRTIYILQKGYCYEKYAGNSFRKTHGPRKVFGYNSFLFSIPEHSQVTALTHCQLVLVDYGVFQMANIEFPSVMKQIRLAIKNSLAGGNVNYDIKMSKYSLDGCDTNKRNKFDLTMKSIYKMKEESFTNMRTYCKNREDYCRPFLKLGHYKWFKYLLMPFTINPYGVFFRIWTCIRLAVAFAYGILGPIQYIVAPYHPMLHFFLSILDCITYIDLYLRFHLAYFDTYGQLVRHPYSTARAYLKGAFYFDVIICFPIEWCFFAIWGCTNNEDIGEMRQNTTLGRHPLYCGLRLFRMLQLYRLVSFVSYSEQELRLKRYTLAIFTYLVTCLVLLNAWACALIALNCTYTNKGDGELSFTCLHESWYSRSRYGKHSSFADVYIAAFYFVTSVSMSLGFGDISPKLYDTLDLTIAMIIVNWLIITYLGAKIIASSQYSSVEQEDHKKMLVFQSKLKELTIFMKDKNTSLTVQQDLKNYVHFIWSRNNGMQNLRTFMGVNDSLLQDCISFLYEDVITKIPLFRKMGRAFYRTFTQDLKEFFFLKGQYVIRSQDVVDQIYIVKNGKVDIFLSDGFLQFTMGPGGIFGNFSQNKMTIFNATIIANTNADLLVLSNEEFKAILNANPLFKKRLESVLVDVKEYYAPNDVKLHDENENITNKRKYVPLYIYHSKFQAKLLMKAHIKNWLDFVFMFSAYLNCLLIIYQFTFQEFSLKYILASVLIDVIFIFKMCLGFNKPIINRFGEPIKALENSYFRRKLNRSVDILINLSSITSYLIFYLPSHSIATTGFTIWRLICLLRIYYVFVFFRNKKKDLLARKFVIMSCAIFVWLSLLVHTCACVWYRIHCPLASCPNDLGSATNTPEPFEMYVTSLYFIICIFTSTGIRDIFTKKNSEMSFIVVLILVANISNAIVLAELANGVYMEFKIRYEHEIINIKCYLKQKGIKQYQVNKVVQYLQNIWKYSYGNKMPRIISELPISIRTDLLWNIYGPTLEESYIFSKTEKPFLRYLVLLVDVQIYFKDDYIIRDSTIDERIYFIYKGEVQIVTHYPNQIQTVHDTLHTGDVFGLGQGLFPGVPHHFSFKANTVTEIISLKREKWKCLLDVFPSSKLIIYDRIENVYI